MIQIKYKSGEALRLRVQLYLRQDTSQVITHQIWSEHLQYLVVLMRYTYPVPLQKNLIRASLKFGIISKFYKNYF